jgi:hypothetical protein
MSSIKDLIDAPHSIYKNNLSYWNFLLQSYEGGLDYCNAFIQGGNAKQGGFVKWAIKLAGTREVQSNQSGNLFKHPKERDEDYLDRLRMSYYYNFCSPILDIYTDHLFKQSVNEKFGSIENDVEKRRDNIDNKGSSINEFRKEMADLAQVYGHIFVITDVPKSGALVQTRQDLIDNNLFPYFTLHHPQNIINWALDEFGAPYWVVVRECLDGNQNPFAYNKEQNSLVQYRLWTRDEWILYDGEFKELFRETHALGIVPITCIFDKQSKKVRNFLGISMIADIAFIARDIYNSCSELKQILRDQTFAFLALQGNSKEYDEISVGTGKGLLYPPERNPPQYVSPPSSNAETYFKHIDRQVTKIFQLAKLEGGSVQAPNGEQGAVEQSGVSKAWDFNQTNSALSKKAGNLEDGETKLWQMFAKWNGQEFDGSIEYPHEFSIQSLNDDLSEVEKMMRLNLGEEFNKEVKAAIIKKKFPRMDEADVKKMITAMETQEDKMGQTESGSLMSRIPSFMNRGMFNANSGGK